MGLSNWAAGMNYQADKDLGTQVHHHGVVYICKLSHTSGSNSEPGVGSFSSTYWGVYSVENVTDVLDTFAAQYPQWAAQGFEIAGYVWFQGNWDIGSVLAAGQYRTNLVQLIKQTRSYYFYTVNIFLRIFFSFSAAVLNFEADARLRRW